MRNTIYRYFFKEFISLFALILISVSVIVWVVQSVNYLDFVTEDGHSFSVYFTFSILTIPKVLNRLIPLVFLISLLVTILQFEKNNELLNKLILDIKNEIDESEKLRTEAKVLLDNTQKKLDSAQSESKKILEQTKKDGDRLVIEMNDKFHKSSEIKKNLAESKIAQMVICKSKKENCLF